MDSVQTPQGEVRLLAPSVELLRTIRLYLPFGLVAFDPPQQGAKAGLVMQCGEHQLYAVKQQPVDCDEKQNGVTFEAHSILIAHSLVTYLAQGFSGLFMPCAYSRPKPGGLFESGIAYFGYPSPQGRESQEYPFDPAYDDQFGQGFTAMMISFIESLQKSSSDTGIRFAQPIGMDVRYRLDLGSLGMGFMVLGPHIICLKTKVSPQDPTWTVLRLTGVKEVYHLPCIPAGISEDELPIAKPDA